MSSFSGIHSESNAFTSQLVNCHAMVSEGHLCARVNTVPAYLEINRVVGAWVIHLTFFYNGRPFLHPSLDTRQHCQLLHCQDSTIRFNRLQNKGSQCAVLPDNSCDHYNASLCIHFFA